MYSLTERWDQSCAAFQRFKLCSREEHVAKRARLLKRTASTSFGGPGGQDKAKVRGCMR